MSSLAKADRWPNSARSLRAPRAATARPGRRVVHSTSRPRRPAARRPPSGVRGALSFCGEYSPRISPMYFDLSFDPFEILGVSASDSLEGLREAYRAKARRHHPDAGGKAWSFRVVKTAYEVLAPASSRSRGGRVRRRTLEAPVFRRRSRKAARRFEAGAESVRSSRPRRRARSSRRPRQARRSREIGERRTFYRPF